ncbi:hypothetical protein V6N11_037755 [Hibiscus sabdariffa]|uniref:Uncharacterized protein n=1 Tax=Hibiscus sabdariffa TaxID=183260 RepID=A0ABR2PEK0_9ROSI
MKVAEKENDENKSSRKQKRDESSWGQSKKANYRKESSMTYTPAPRSNFISRPQSVIKSYVWLPQGNARESQKGFFLVNSVRTDIEVNFGFNPTYAMLVAGKTISSGIVLTVLRKLQLDLLQTRVSLCLFGLKDLNKLILETEEEVEEVIQMLLLDQSLELQLVITTFVVESVQMILQVLLNLI